MWNLIKGSLGLKEDPTSQSNPEYSLEGLTKTEAPILWPPASKSQLLGKDPDAGKD